MRFVDAGDSIMLVLGSPLKLNHQSLQYLSENSISYLFISSSIDASSSVMNKLGFNKLELVDTCVLKLTDSLLIDSLLIEPVMISDSVTTFSWIGVVIGALSKYGKIFNTENFKLP